MNQYYLRFLLVKVQKTVTNTYKLASNNDTQLYTKYFHEGSIKLSNRFDEAITFVPNKRPQKDALYHALSAYLAKGNIDKSVYYIENHRTISQYFYEELVTCIKN